LCIFINKIMGYLSEQSLNKLVNDPGKYQMDDTSVISHHLNAWWTFCASFVPDFISANVVTVGAAGPLILCWILSMFYAYQPGSDGLPCWLLILSGFAVFFFQTMDAVDGKHARRLGTSSSLGDFLDHVMDSISIMTSTYLICRSLGLRSIPFEYFALVDASLSFVVVHWESAKILVMKLDNGSSITECQLSFTFLLLLTAFTGKELWQIALFGMPSVSLGKVVAVGIMCAITVVQCYKSLSRVLAKCEVSVLPELFIPIVCSALVAVSWVLLLPEDQSIVPFQMVLLSSTVVHSCCITLNRLTLQPIVPTTTLPATIPALILVLIVPASFRVTAAWIAGIWAIAYMMYFLFDVVTTIAHTLHVPVFAQPELKKTD